MPRRKTFKMHSYSKAYEDAFSRIAQRHVEAEWKSLHSILAKLSEAGFTEEEVQEAIVKLSLEEYPASVNHIYRHLTAIRRTHLQTTAESLW